MDFVEVARARGERLWWITRREILPNVLGPLAAEFGIRFTYAILFISALSFLGLGVQPPAADWGVMVKENLQGLFFGSAATLLPAASVASLTVGINLNRRLVLAPARWRGCRGGASVTHHASQLQGSINSSLSVSTSRWQRILWPDRGSRTGGSSLSQRPWIASGQRL